LDAADQAIPGTKQMTDIMPSGVQAQRLSRHARAVRDDRCARRPGGRSARQDPRGGTQADQRASRGPDDIVKRWASPYLRPLQIKCAPSTRSGRVHGLGYLFNFYRTSRAQESLGSHPQACRYESVRSGRVTSTATTRCWRTRRIRSDRKRSTKFGSRKTHGSPSLPKSHPTTASTRTTRGSSSAAMEHSGDVIFGGRPDVVQPARLQVREQHGGLADALRAMAAARIRSRRRSTHLCNALSRRCTTFGSPHEDHVARRAPSRALPRSTRSAGGCRGRRVTAVELANHGSPRTELRTSFRSRSDPSVSASHLVVVVDVTRWWTASNS